MGALSGAVYGEPSTSGFQLQTLKARSHLPFSFVQKLNRFVIIIIVFCSSNQQSQAVTINTELVSKATKHRELTIS